jgi:hypothetical protein
MSTATIPPATAHPVPTAPPAAGDPSAVRTLLVGYGVELLPLLVALLALEFGWERIADGTWAAASAAMTGWALAIAGWLRSRGRRACTVLTVTCTPAAVLAATLPVGWLSPAGLVLWGPVSTVLTVALTMAVQPPASATSHPADLPAPA